MIVDFTLLCADLDVSQQCQLTSVVSGSLAENAGKKSCAVLLAFLPQLPSVLRVIHVMCNPFSIQLSRLLCSKVTRDNMPPRNRNHKTSNVLSMPCVPMFPMMIFMGGANAVQPMAPSA